MQSTYPLIDDVESIETFLDIEELDSYDNPFIKYFEANPGFFLRDGEADSVVAALYERVIQEVYDSQFDKRPDKLLKFDNPNLSLFEYCKSHPNVPMASENEHGSTIISAGPLSAFRDDIVRAMYLGRIDSESTKTSSEGRGLSFWQSVKLLGAYTVLISSLAVAGFYVAVDNLRSTIKSDIEKEVSAYLDVHDEDGERVLHPQVEELSDVIEERSRNAVRDEISSFYSDGVPSDDLKLIVDYIKSEVSASSEESIRDFFNYETDAEGNIVNEDLNDFFTYLDAHLESRADDFIERFKNDQEFRDKLIDSLAKSLLGD